MSMMTCIVVLACAGSMPKPLKNNGRAAPMRMLVMTTTNSETAIAMASPKSVPVRGGLVGWWGGAVVRWCRCGAAERWDGRDTGWGSTDTPSGG